MTKFVVAGVLDGSCPTSVVSSAAALALALIDGAISTGLGDCCCGGFGNADNGAEVCDSASIVERKSIREIIMFC